MRRSTVKAASAPAWTIRLDGNVDEMEQGLSLYQEDVGLGVVGH